MLRTPFILASRSPRRKQLLERIGFTFEVVGSPVEEVMPAGVAPADLVQTLALEKAASVAGGYPDALTLGADTVVVLHGDILGKPAHAEEARAMLQRLADQTHTVYTGIALLHPASGREVTACEATTVTFGPMGDSEIDAYVATGSPLDKAGAYGIQDDRGALFVARIEGDYYSVVGLPLHRFYTALKAHFADLMI